VSDDHSPGDGRQPYSDRGGPQARHAETHDVRREQLTNPTGPPEVDESFDEQLPAASATPEIGGHADESRPAADDKELHRQMQNLDGADLARLAVLEPGAALEQGGTYVDLNDLKRGPFKAIGGQTADSDQRYVAKRDTDYEIWNRVVGQGREPDVERPDESDA